MIFTERLMLALYDLRDGGEVHSCNENRRSRTSSATVVGAERGGASVRVQVRFGDRLGTVRVVAREGRWRIDGATREALPALIGVSDYPDAEAQQSATVELTQTPEGAGGEPIVRLLHTAGPGQANQVTVSP